MKLYVMKNLDEKSSQKIIYHQKKILRLRNELRRSDAPILFRLSLPSACEIGENCTRFGPDRQKQLFIIRNLHKTL